MQPDETVQAHVDLRGHWLVPVHNGTFDLARHRWQEPYERIVGLSAARGIALATPRMGERLDLSAPHRGEKWWREIEERVQETVTPRRWFSCRHGRQASS